MRLGIVGLPQSGKTTLFNALTSSTIPADEAAAKKEAHLSIVKVPDPRLDRLHELYPTAKKTPTDIEYIDVGGLARGSTQRKGFQEQFLSNLRNVNALVCVLRQFENDAVPHSELTLDPRRDLKIISEEFLFSDMAILEGRIERLRADVKKIKNPDLSKELELLERCLETLEQEQPLRELALSADEEKKIRGYQFLTAKPLLVVLNIGESDLENISEVAQIFADLADSKNSELVCLSGNLEMEISQLSDDDREEFQQEMGITEPALNRMIRSSYDLLGLISFFTAGEKEVRAWTIRKETRAQEAAGAIHSDMERGFIRAEVVDFETLSELRSLNACKEKGVLRLEGKDYIVKDGDVITFRFNV